MDYRDYYYRLYRDYYRDPVPHPKSAQWLGLRIAQGFPPWGQVFLASEFGVVQGLGFGPRRDEQLDPVSVYNNCIGLFQGYGSLFCLI